ncbi:MAG: flagellar biosynthesis protein FlhB [Chitinispirillaceae bacterium]|nr:flagellar biosynthesis protein FlhB [Chitinispirillaceae bacterium]
MADESKDDKTETATPKRRQESREKGSVAKSTEINSVIVLLTGLLMLKFFGNWMLERMGSCMIETFRSIATFELSAQQLVALMTDVSIQSILMILPVCVAIMLFGLIANIVQIGFLFTAKPITPDLKKINPISGFARLFSMKTVVETIKNILKLFIIGLVAYLTIKAEFDKIMLLSDAGIGFIISFTMSTAFQIILRVALVLVIIAILDLAYQRYDHEKQMRMTKQEVKDEHKQMEGDPKVKSRIKSLQREMARRRMMQEVPKATVVVTNPTYIAIALRYEPSQNDAPVVVAKGKRLIAEKIRQIAVENGIPIIEDKPLARGMYDKIDVGSPIPAEFFTAVAEIMAYVYRLKHRKAA